MHFRNLGWAFSFVLLCQLFTNLTFGQAPEKEGEQVNFWSKNKTYHYVAVYLDSLGDTLTREHIRLHPTEEVWDMAPRQTLMEIELDFSATDSARFAPFPLNHKSRAWRSSYREGVIQNAKRVWMHPIRSNQYVLTELAPFPEVVFPLRADTSWENTLWIYEAFGSFEGTVECNYHLHKKESRSYAFGSLNCWKIKAIGIHDRLGSNAAEYFFHPEYGFTEMNYIFFNGQQLKFTLVEFEQ